MPASPSQSTEGLAAVRRAILLLCLHSARELATRNRDSGLRRGPVTADPRWATRDNGAVLATLFGDPPAEGSVGTAGLRFPARVTLADDSGDPIGGPRTVVDAAALAALDRAETPRWLFDSAVHDYPAVLAAGCRLARSYDVSLTERILLGRAGRFGEPSRVAAVLARAAGASAPDDPEPPEPVRGAAPAGQPLLFGGSPAPRAASSSDLLAAYRDQRRRIEASADGADAPASGIAVPTGALKLLVAAESGSALVAAEMTARGMPWDSRTHDAILTETLGPRPTDGVRPPRLQALAERITEAFGFPVNPDSPIEVREALGRSGFPVESTRAWVLKEIEHPAIEPLLDYKDRARLYTANGWHWLEEWIVDGRLAAQFLPGAVVSGRWATRGGGGLQLPAALRRAAVAQPGHLFVVADAAQLEPRVLAAVSRDQALGALATGDDLYAALAADGFGGDRRHAKLAMLGAMYGQTSGEAARLMATMRIRYPAAVGHVEAAAEVGETGGVVRSVLGRACPPPSQAWRRAVGSGADGARRVARDRGRFTRNFVIQASAADWAAVWMTTLRLDLLEAVPAAELVLFQHDELVAHVPAGRADEVARLMVDAAARARDLVFPGSEVAIPVRPQIVACYADAK